jgi:DNA repair protein RecO
MGYKNASGVILRRRDVFDDDQMISVLTSNGCVEARAPHARKSQKTFCGRLEPPNSVSVRLYRTKNQSQWIVSSIELDQVFAELLRDHDLRRHLWPLLALFRDLFPEGESPGDCLPHLRKGLNFLLEGLRPVSLVTNRILTMVSKRSGIAFELSSCAKCGRSFEVIESENDKFGFIPETGVICGDCKTAHSDQEAVWTLKGSTLLLYRRLLTKEWGEVCAEPVSEQALGALEEFLYRLFHYHFEISLETLKVRKSL